MLRGQQHHHVDAGHYDIPAAILCSMAFPAVDSVEAVTRRFKELLEKARKVKPSDSIEPQISATDLLDGESLLLSENIQNQVSHNTVAEIAAKNLLHHLVVRVCLMRLPCY